MRSIDSFSRQDSYKPDLLSGIYNHSLGGRSYSVALKEAVHCAPLHGSLRTAHQNKSASWPPVTAKPCGTPLPFDSIRALLAGDGMSTLPSASSAGT